MEGLINKVITIIGKNQLNKKKRYRKIIHQKYYLFYVLRSKGLKLTNIGALFNTHHSSIIHGINQYKYLDSVNDKLLKADIKHLLEMNLEQLEIEEEYVLDEKTQLKMKYYNMKYELLSLKTLINSICNKFEKEYQEIN
jgi:hypothetical protein